MAQVKFDTTVFRVVLTEYDRFSGPSELDTIYFDNETEARQYAIDYNTKNNDKSYVPDWYVRADYKGRVK